MRDSLFRSRWIGFAAALLVSAAPSLSADTGFLSPASGERLESGTVVQLQWSLDGIPSGFGESELVLSLDGGGTFPVRVTGDFDPSTRRILWRVPALPTDQARLALRAGNDEGPAEETLALVSPTFAISGSGPDSGLEELFAVGSEWRTREALDFDPWNVRETGLHGDSSDEQIHAGLSREIAAQSGSRAAILPDRLPAAAIAVAPVAPERSAESVFGERRCPTPLRE